MAQPTHTPTARIKARAAEVLVVLDRQFRGRATVAELAAALTLTADATRAALYVLEERGQVHKVPTRLADGTWPWVIADE